jgi:gamma-glutamyltranspeptidase/glutathione hydrolase
MVNEAEAAGSDRDEQIEHRRRAFSRGFIAEAIVRFATRDKVATRVDYVPVEERFPE